MRDVDAQDAMTSSLIICVKNEEKTLESVIDHSKPYVDEIIVVDGHSTDASRRIAKKLGTKVFLDNGKGKGAAMRLGMEKAHGDILIFVDADGSHETRDIPRLIRPIRSGTADMVLASRTVGGSDELNGSMEKTIRMIGSAIITQIINSHFHTKLTDTQNGFRALRASIIPSLRLSENIFTIEQEMIMKMLKKGYRITEIPSHEFERKYGNSHIDLFRMSWRYIWILIKNLF